MIFKIDTIPLTNNPAFSADYISRLICSATADPLLRLDSSTKYIPNSCIDITTSGFKSFIIRIQKDLYYNNG